MIKLSGWWMLAAVAHGYEERGEARSAQATRRGALRPSDEEEREADNYNDEQQQQQLQVQVQHQQQLVGSLHSALQLRSFARSPTHRQKSKHFTLRLVEHIPKYELQ